MLDMLNQSSMPEEETDMNHMIDERINELLLSGKNVHRDTMRNKVFVQNEFGFIGDQLARTPEEEEKGIRVPTKTSPKELAKDRKREQV